LYRVHRTNTHVGRQYCTTLTSPRSHRGSVVDGDTGEETDKLTSPAIIIVDAYITCAVAGEEADES
jgi:hypothetical protein